MEHRIYEARLVKDHILEVSFFTGEVKEVEIKRLASYAEKFALLEVDDIQIEKPVVNDNNKTISLPVRFDGEAVEYVMDCDTLFENGITVENRYIDNVNVQLAGRLTVVRDSLLMTQKELEMASGIHQADISRIERGLGNPSLDTIVRLAAAMHHKVRIEIIPEIKDDALSPMDEELLKYLPSYKKQGEYSVRDINNLPDDIKDETELVDGVIYRYERQEFAQHDIASTLCTIFSDYIRDNNIDGKVMLAPFLLRESGDESARNSVRPDIGVYLGRNKLPEGNIFAVSPNFVCEITSERTYDIDMGAKKELYKRLGVAEYWVLDPVNKQLIIHKIDDLYCRSYTYSGDEKVSVGFLGNNLNINLRGLWRFCGN